MRGGCCGMDSPSTMTDDERATDRWLHPSEWLGGPRLPFTREEIARAAGDDPDDPFIHYIGMNGKIFAIDESVLIEWEHELFRTFRVDPRA